MTWIDTYTTLRENNIKDKVICEELLRSIQSCNDEIAIIESKTELYDRTIELFLNVSEYSKVKIQHHFESFVTYILKYVFGDDYSFEVIWSTGAKSTSVDFVVISPCEQGMMAINPTKGKGGGVCDVVAFGLRLAFLTLLHNDAPIFLDESFSQLSKSYIPSVASLLNDINDKFGYQILFITHARDSAFTENSNNLISL